MWTTSNLSERELAIQEGVWLISPPLLESPSEVGARGLESLPPNPLP